MKRTGKILLIVILLLLLLSGCREYTLSQQHALCYHALRTTEDTAGLLAGRTIHVTDLNSTSFTEELNCATIWADVIAVQRNGGNIVPAERK